LWPIGLGKARLPSHQPGTSIENGSNPRQNVFLFPIFPPSRLNPAAAAIFAAATQGKGAPTRYSIYSISSRGDSFVFALFQFLRTIMTIVKNLTKKLHGMGSLSF
jgi:hypothetical protein